MSPAPVPPPTWLALVLAALDRPGSWPAGVWLASARAPSRLILACGGRPRPAFVAPDLHWLSARAARVVVRLGRNVVALRPDALILGRVLQVVTATPYLPAIARLDAILPELRVTPAGLEAPLDRYTPEEVLAACAGAGLRVAASRVAYRASVIDDGTPEPLG